MNVLISVHSTVNTTVNTALPHCPPLPLDLLPVLDELASQGWCVRPDVLAAEAIAALRELCLDRLARGAFHAAGVGGGAARVLTEVRGDRILWVEADDPNPAVRLYLEAMESLRLAVNRDLFLGLQELEAHFAAYPPGAGYARHLDRFRSAICARKCAIFLIRQVD